MIYPYGTLRRKDDGILQGLFNLIVASLALAALWLFFWVIFAWRSRRPPKSAKTGRLDRFGLRMIDQKIAGLKSPRRIAKWQKRRARFSPPAKPAKQS